MYCVQDHLTDFLRGDVGLTFAMFFINICQTNIFMTNLKVPIIVFFFSFFVCLVARIGGMW